VIVVLEPFALGSIEARFGAELDRGVEAALRHYARRLLSRRRPPEVPLFMRDVPVDREAATEIEVAVPDEVRVALGREAGRQEVELDRIVAHAVFVYLDDIAGDRAGVDGAEEVGSSPRYPGHASGRQSNARRPRGTTAGGRLLRRGRSAGGGGRFGRR
jgi:hypothetical protein